MRTRQWYIDALREGANNAERYWLAEEGDYAHDLRANAMILPALIVLAQEGDEGMAKRVQDLAEKFTHTPPWDPDHHYFSDWHVLGREPHMGASTILSGLSFAVKHAEEIGLAPKVRDRLREMMRQYSAKFTGWLHPEKKPGYVVHIDHVRGPMKKLLEQVGGIEPYVEDPVPDAEGYILIGNLEPLYWAILKRGLNPDFRYLEYWGPNNQQCWVMRALAHAYLATGEDHFMENVGRMWRAVIREERDGCGIPHPSSLAVDFTFPYTPFDPLRNYEMSIYDYSMITMYADILRIERMAGTSKGYVEEFYRRWLRAWITRIGFLDGTVNMVFNLYGWERVFAMDILSIYTSAMVSMADLLPVEVGVMKQIFEAGVERVRRSAFDTTFPPETGLVDSRGAGGKLSESTTIMYEIAVMLLTHPGFFQVEARPYRGMLSSFAWKDEFFVAQTPSYYLTIVGAGPGYGKNDHGTPFSGGEYNLKIPFSHFLTPQSDEGRTLLEAVVNGRELSSRDVCIHEKEKANFEMAMELPDGTVLKSGKDYGDLLYDPTVPEVTVRVRFGNEEAQLERLFTINAERLIIEDSIEALADVTVERAFSRLPIISANAAREVPRITGITSGQSLEILPPYYMMIEGLRGHDQNLKESLRRLERIEVRFQHYGFTVNQLSDCELRIDLTDFEWVEHRRMWVAGKNLDYVWIFEPVSLTKGQRRSFRYEIMPYSDGFRLSGG